MAQGNTIGRKIKKFREFRQMSRDELALKSNIDVSQLDFIEEKGNVPSLGHLIKITRVFGVPIGTFLDDQDHVGPVIIRKGEQKKALSFSTKNEKSREHLNFYSLAQDKAGRHMEPFIVEIEPGKEPDYKLSSHEGEEFIFVLSGEIEINYGKKLIRLEKGDSIYLDSIVAHNLHAFGDNNAKILAVIYYPA